MSGNCCALSPNAVIGNNTNAAIASNVNPMAANTMQMKPAAGTSGVSHAMVGPSSSHHMHSVPLNLTLKGVMSSVSRTPNATAQPANANLQSGDMHCANTNVPGSSNGKQQHSLFRKPTNIHILPPTHSSIRNLAYHQMSTKNSHCNTATFNANGALQTKQ